MLINNGLTSCSHTFFKVLARSCWLSICTLNCGSEETMLKEAWARASFPAGLAFVAELVSTVATEMKVSIKQYQIWY